MSIKLNLTGDRELIKAFNQMGDKQTEFAVIDLSKEPAKAIAKRAKAKTPKSRKGSKGFGVKISGKSGTLKRSLNQKNALNDMKRTRSGHKMVGQYVQVRAGSFDWFYFFHNMMPLSDRSGKGRISKPTGDVVKKAAGEIDQAEVNKMEQKIFKVIARKFKRAMR